MGSPESRHAASNWSSGMITGAVLAGSLRRTSRFTGSMPVTVTKWLGVTSFKLGSDAAPGSVSSPESTMAMTGWPAARWSSKSPTVPVVSTASPPVGATKWSMVASSCSGLRPDQYPQASLPFTKSCFIHPCSRANSATSSPPSRPPVMALMAIAAE